MASVCFYRKKNKREDNFYLAAAIVIGATALLMIARNTTFLMALAFAIPTAILIPWLRYQFLNPHLKNTEQETIVKIYSNCLIVNNKTIHLFNKNRWLKDMQIIDTKSDLKLLEFTIEWGTRRGNTNDETRIPIPANKLEKAKEMIDFYRHYDPHNS